MIYGKGVFLPEHSSARLPAEYQEVEWIGKSRSGYYLTCIKPNLTWNDFDKIEFLGYRDNWDTYTGSSGIMLLASFNSNESYRSSPYIAITTGNPTFSGVSGTMTPVYNKAQVRETGFKQFTIELTSHSNARQVEFGAWHDAAWGSTWQTKEQLWYLGTTLVRDLVPCYRKADTVIGKYDLITNAFFTNAGDGSLEKGPDVIYS